MPGDVLQTTHECAEPGRALQPSHAPRGPIQYGCTAVTRWVGRPEVGEKTRCGRSKVENCWTVPLSKRTYGV